MAVINVSRQELERLVQDLAKQEAARRGLGLSRSALVELTAPGKAYFSNRGPIIGVGQGPLRKQVTEIVRGSIRELDNDQSASGREAQLAAKPGKSPSIGGPHVQRAIGKSKCHYIWFC